MESVSSGTTSDQSLGHNRGNQMNIQFVKDGGERRRQDQQPMMMDDEEQREIDCQYLSWKL